MTREPISRGNLGPLTKIGQGGQGVVYRAPKVKTKFANALVYKEYKAAVRGDIDFDALSSMPELVENSLSYADGERLISVAAWPCAIVEDQGQSTGFVMPEIPERFFISLTTLKGVSSNAAEFQHLLNPETVLHARGIAIDEVTRYALLLEIASTLAFLHSHGVCVGDISPKNLLFGMEPRAAIYFIDCDGMRIGNVSALPQVETPGWEVPPGEELATVYSDSYKLGLLALRLLAGDQDVKTGASIPSTVPNLMRSLITDSLRPEPQKRPLPATWIYLLGQALEEAQHRQKTEAVQKKAAMPATKITQAATVPPPPTTPRRSPVPAPVPASAPSPVATAASGRAGWIALAGAVVALFVVGALLIGGFSQSDTSSTGASTRQTTSEISTSASGTSSAPTSGNAWKSPTASALPPLVTAPDSNNASCPDGYHFSNQSGWATHAGRGSTKTSCTLAYNVLMEYWGYGSADHGTRTISVRGSVDCPSVRSRLSSVACNGDAFVMTCSSVAGESWITCTGGDDARVYLY